MWIGANIATMAGAGAYGSMQDSALAVKGERIAWLGSAAEGRRMAQAQGAPMHEVPGQWITPGLIDCHTHLVYGGNRVAEFEQRLCGASYEEIARAGGGIQSTMRDTRAATEQTLYESALARLKCLLAEGITTIEIKSGYGLELVAERRILEVARRLGENLPVSVKKTFLGLHSLPPEFAAQRQRFIDEVSDARCFGGEGVQLVHHDVNGVLQFENFALHVRGNLLGQVALRDGRRDFGDVTDLRRKVASHDVH